VPILLDAPAEVGVGCGPPSGGPASTENTGSANDKAKTANNKIDIPILFCFFNVLSPMDSLRSPLEGGS
jgi:phosphoglucomutase